MTRDPGLQPERTALAWTRTSVAMGMNALLVVRMGAQSEDRSVMALGLVLAVVALTLFGAGHYRHRRLRRSAMAPPTPLVAFAAGSVVLAASIASLAMAA